MVSDAHSGLIKAIQTSFPGASWQRCKVHFMSNIRAYVSQRDKAAFAASLKLIWQAGEKKTAREQVESLRSRYEK